MSPRIAFLSRAGSSALLPPASAADGKPEDEEAAEGRWGKMLPEILSEIARRVEESSPRWPARRNLVAFACTCRKWREAAKGLVRPPSESGRITFPISLKQAGPRCHSMQCFIRRDKRNSTYYLYLGLTTVTNACMDAGKFLMAARRTRRGAHIEYVISLDADDLSQGSNAYMGKLRSDFLGINFALFDSHPPFSGAKAVRSRSSRRFTSKQISPQVPAENFEIGHVSYKFNILRSRGPRRMECSLQGPMVKPTAEKKAMVKSKSMSSLNVKEEVILKNKAPRWHEHLQCWCLNFHGRVTVASVKNFQLVVATDPSQQKDPAEDETVVLQFGKVDDDIFTMDYRDPLSAFQAFAICLTSFGTKLACE